MVHGGFLSHRGTPSHHPVSWDSPWNKPCSYWATPMAISFVETSIFLGSTMGRTIDCKVHRGDMSYWWWTKKAATLRRVYTSHFWWFFWIVFLLAHYMESRVLRIEIKNKSLLRIGDLYMPFIFFLEPCIDIDHALVICCQSAWRLVHYFGQIKQIHTRTNIWQTPSGMQLMIPWYDHVTFKHQYASRIKQWCETNVKH